MRGIRLEGTAGGGAVSPERDWFIDVVRVSAMLIVVLMHWTLMRVTIVNDQVAMEFALHGPWAVAATWVLQVMPLFFIAGGFANTVTMDKVRRGGGGFGGFVGVRVRRLLTPLVPLMVLVAVLEVGLNLLGNRGAVDLVADQSANILWFLSVYLLCVALTPVLVGWHDRGVWWLPVVVLAGLVVVFDVLRYQGLGPRPELTNLFLVWLFIHQLGVLYARRTLHRLPAGALIAISVAAALVMGVLVAWGPYAPVNLGIGGVREQNLMPANGIIALLGVFQLPLVVLAGRQLAGWRPGVRVQRVIKVLNLSLMLVFLWHLPALFASIGIGMIWSDALLPADEGRWWLLRPLWWVVQSAILAGLVALALRWELFCHRFAGRTRLLPVLLGAAIGVVSLFQLWERGLAIFVRGTGMVDVRAVAMQGAVLVAIAFATRVFSAPNR